MIPEIESDIKNQSLSVNSTIQRELLTS